MINATDLHAFLGKIDGGSVAVDLLKIVPAANGKKQKSNNGKLRLALDMEDCLDRFYGGYYSDWACGGQWNRAYQFVQLLANAFSSAQIEIIAFFDGTLRENKRLDGERSDFRQKTISVLKHIRMIGTPPPKIWWLPPSGLRTCLRNAMRNINIQVVQTIQDHTMEVIEYFHEHRLDGILGVHPDYIVANCSRYFSSHDIRLSYKGSLETKEYHVSKLLSTLSLTADHLPFVAVLLGGYVAIDETQLKAIYGKLSVEAGGDFEARIRKIAEIVRNSPTNDTNEFIKHLKLEDHAAAITESVEYYQRKGKFLVRKYLGNKKKISFEVRAADGDPVPMASETSENDEVAKKILSDVNNLVDESENYANGKESSGTNASGTKEKTSTGGHFIYTLPGEVLKTSLNRHQRGMMDSRIYQLLTKKSIVLPQVLEDEQSRDVPSVHLFYRPARQMIYAILFNLYHQRYLCSKSNKNQTNASSAPKPDVVVSEWIWSPQNEYKKPDMVKATQLSWAVPTVQRLWFGMAFEDKQRRMKAFLTIMRSDSLLMLNRGYVPQHMLVMACVLRYMITDPDRSMLTRQELDAFLATAFSHQLLNVEYTQELVLPCVHLRGVYLATLFMQGVETASLANDACGIPLPWLMVNPWLFFDGKLFHLKLKMSTYVQSLRELCDDQIEIVLKIERFRKAILEDVEHYLLPTHIDHTMYRPGFLPQPQAPNLPQHFGKGQLHQMANIPQAPADHSGAYYSSQVAAASASYYGAPITSRVLPGAGVDAAAGCVPMRGRGAGGMYPQQRAGGVPAARNGSQKGYQLKVGASYTLPAGVVVGSWAAGGSGAQMRAAMGGVQNAGNGNAGRAMRLAGRAGNAVARFGVTGRGSKGTAGNRLHRGQVGAQGSRGAAGYAYGGKTVRTKNRKGKKEKKSTKAKAEATAGTSNGKETTDDVTEVTENLNKVSLESSTVELQNGTTVLASDLANSMCDEILKEEESEQQKKKADAKADTADEAAGASTSAVAENESAPETDTAKLKMKAGTVDKKTEENGSGSNAVSGQEGQDVPVNN
ncbi:constitutive coactivator of PPAR-gamma-like protein 1 homolog isoform X3 [Lutzomyia longipalpis]|uniref:constitutive coactivator of PPAR-gamma-like protein 1 homolog isoform X3 n=1 Tax=Lutzomyia longipalpis TaxID=7200 RepID=UPI00248396FF|nr:constitutive coactivator of PPAR-gamma-like protein 1 homolog isoform X3 [Lutzomyia longipalpis]XP_055678274.1 constitutive coactivator of PPAR-gamma-like protein 1 homolog isoform X3 [Lutzomyia longipalpis]